ncbi:MAG: nucleotidyltransferase domain-containing protein [Patescibacteria group bacterium]
MDIFKLKKSKTREKIVRLFFSDISKKYYLRELERILGFSVGNIRREILSLEESSILKKSKNGNQIYYYVNKESPIFEEFKKIVSKTIGVEAQIKEFLEKIDGIISAFIFGSFAKEKEGQFSDIDLMIVGNPDEGILISRISKVEEKLAREINYSIFSEKDIQKGLRKKNVFLENVMENSKIFIIGDQNDLEKIIGGRKSSAKES